MGSESPAARAALAGGVGRTREAPFVAGVQELLGVTSGWWQPLISDVVHVPARHLRCWSTVRWVRLVSQQ